MGVQIQFEIEGVAEVSAELGIVATKVTNWTKPLTSIGSQLLKSFDLNFSSRGALFGGWPERKPQYRKGERVDTWPLMEKTGTLRNSFYSEVQGSAVVMGNPTPYFGYHQSRGERSRLPRRVMMKIDEERRNFIFKTFQLHIVEAIRGSK